MKSLYLGLSACIIFGNIAAFAAEEQVSVVVDTGNHTCTQPGQEYKRYAALETTPDRYFDKETARIEEISIFGEGICRIEKVHERKIPVKLPSGKEVTMAVPYKIDAYVYADCTMDLRKLTTRVGRECKFSASTIRID